MQEFNSGYTQPAWGATASLDLGAITRSAIVGAVLFGCLATLSHIPAAREILDRPAVQKAGLDLFVSLLGGDGTAPGPGLTPN